jgi:hypothetical protein
MEPLLLCARVPIAEPLGYGTTCQEIRIRIWYLIYAETPRVVNKIAACSGIIPFHKPIPADYDADDRINVAV